MAGTKQARKQTGSRKAPREVEEEILPPLPPAPAEEEVLAAYRSELIHQEDEENLHDPLLAELVEGSDNWQESYFAGEDSQLVRCPVCHYQLRPCLMPENPHFACACPATKSLSLQAPKVVPVVKPRRRRKR